MYSNIVLTLDPPIGNIFIDESFAWIGHNNFSLKSLFSNLRSLPQRFTIAFTVVIIKILDVVYSFLRSEEK